MKFEDFFTADASFHEFSPKWDSIMELQEFKDMETCPHSFKWHKEGSPMNHTRLVVANMVDMVERGSFFEHSTGAVSIKKKKILLLAALFHDIGKPKTTIEKNGDYSAPFHGEAGVSITRTLLYDEDIEVREGVCFMVLKHMMMHNLRDFKNYNKIERAMMDFNQCFHDNSWVNWNMMCTLGLCDEMGSVRFDTSFVKKYENQEYMVNYPERTLNITQVTPLTKDRMNGLMGWDNPAHKEEITVYVMIGNAGSGKSTYIEKNLSGIPVISRDIMRAELGYCKPGEKRILDKEKENNVSDALKRKMVEYAEAGKDFVIDDMNLKLAYRTEYHDLLCHRRKIKWVYIYVEAPSLAENIRRRYDEFGRTAAASIITPMVGRLEFPYEWEYDELIIYKQK